ncbi:DUF2889 domain-containing protein [Paraburkholderia sp. C35]|uniref:DUF2889 domain-containing protein n=1 Tax=Paraburkholderia sp. C35 TaxID=2126993 RepID=UPI001EF4AD20|nr:DUF2889 domain-containing protein [Paraburkholderia sp. C35]
MSEVSPPALQDARDQDRMPLHTRNIALQGYRRADGLYDIEGHLRDTKSYDRASHGVFVKAGQPIHEMLLRITIGIDFVIRDVHVESMTIPYAGYCDAIAVSYGKLKGMKLGAGFMREARSLFGGVNGCTHMTELIGAVATAAFQTMSEELNASATERPFQLDGCHALRTDGPIVKAFHPKWYKADSI